MTSTLRQRTDSLRDTLEQQFRTHTEQLAELTRYSRQPDLGGYDADMLRGLMHAARRGIADTAGALRRMAEGSYGTCERCRGTIPVARLKALPWARFCVACQSRQYT